MHQAPIRSILITGCSSGIGYYCAHALQERGYEVIASARKTKDVARLQKEGLNCLQLDLADESSVVQAAQQVLAMTHGRLYALFNNGAYGQPGAVEDLTRHALRAQLETNLLGWHDLTRHLLPAMREQGEGRIIQNSSVLGFAAMPFRGAYNCSKFALEGLTDTLRLELAGSGVFVSLIEPGPIRSQFRKNAYQQFLNHIDWQHSRFRGQYENMIQRLEKQGDATAFTLEPEAVFIKLLHALESPRPRPRYYVTTPTYVLGFAKRLLSSRAMDWLLNKASGDGGR